MTTMTTTTTTGSNQTNGGANLYKQMHQHSAQTRGGATTRGRGSAYYVKEATSMVGIDMNESTRGRDDNGSLPLPNFVPKNTGQPRMIPAAVGGNRGTQSYQRGGGQRGGYAGRTRGGSGGGGGGNEGEEQQLDVWTSDGIFEKVRKTKKEGGSVAAHFPDGTLAYEITRIGTTSYKVAAWRELLLNGRFAFGVVNPERKKTSPQNLIHHEPKLSKMNGSAVDTKRVVFDLGMRKISSIHRFLSPQSETVQHYVHIDIFANWPDRDANGEALLSLCEQMVSSYGNNLDENLPVKAEIFGFTGKGKDPSRPKEPARPPADIEAESLIDSIVQWPTYEMNAKHGDNAGKLDPSKSPNIKMKLWVGGIKSGGGGSADGADGQSEDRRSVYLSSKSDPSYKNQTLYTSVIDKRQGTKGYRNQTPISSEEELNDFVYSKGDSTKGKYPFCMIGRVEILPPSVYWEAKDPLGKFQFKIKTLEIYDKSSSQRVAERTEEELDEGLAEALALKDMMGGTFVSEEVDNKAPHDEEAEGQHLERGGWEGEVDIDGNPMRFDADGNIVYDGPTPPLSPSDNNPGEGDTAPGSGTCDDFVQTYAEDGEAGYQDSGIGGGDWDDASNDDSGIPARASQNRAASPSGSLKRPATATDTGYGSDGAKRPRKN